MVGYVARSLLLVQTVLTAKHLFWLLSQSAVAELGGIGNASKSEPAEARLHYTKDLLPALQLSDLQVVAALQGLQRLPYMLCLMNSLSQLLTWRNRC